MWLRSCLDLQKSHSLGKENPKSCTQLPSLVAEPVYPSGQLKQTPVIQLKQSAEWQRNTNHHLHTVLSSLPVLEKGTGRTSRRLSFLRKTGILTSKKGQHLVFCLKHIEDLGQPCLVVVPDKQKGKKG